MFFVGTGTAANALSLTLANRPGGVGFCYREAHATEDECGAPEYFTGGARLCPVDGPAGRIDPASLDRAIARYPAGVRALRPADLRVDHPVDRDRHGLWPRRHRRDRGDLPQGTPAAAHGRRAFRQCAGVARRDAGGDDLEARRRRAVLRRHQERLLVRRGDRAVRPGPGGEMAFIRKRAAQLYSKSRFIAAQFHAYFEDGLWLETARHANSLAARLAGRIRDSRTLRLAWEPAGQRGLRDHERQREGAARRRRAPCSSAGTRRNSIAASSPRTNRSRGSSPASRPPPKTSTRSRDAVDLTGIAASPNSNEKRRPKAPLWIVCRSAA